jgi:molybdopterin-containing oxidoreductase family iron-sulfur binding subunit
MEKCSFCIQRIQRSTRESERDEVDLKDGDRRLNPACVNSCSAEALIFGDFNDEKSRISEIKRDEYDNDEGRGYRLFENIGTSPNVIYLKQFEESTGDVDDHH